MRKRHGVSACFQKVGQIMYTTKLLMGALCASTLLSGGVSAQEGVELEPIDVMAEGASGDSTAGPVDGYKAFTASSLTRTPTDIREIPQSIQVITRDLIEDQQADTVSKVVRNVSGVHGIENREGTSQLDGDFLIRGQFTESFVNGRMTYLEQGFDPNSTINAERVEVLKGPSSSLFAGGKRGTGEWCD